MEYAKLSIQELTNLAEKGHSDAQNNLGNCYKNGKGVPCNYIEAFYWYQKSADQGNKKGQENLADCYEYGRGVPRNKLKAFYWRNKANNN